MSRNFGDLYNIRGWGEPYFAVNAEGNFVVKVKGYETTTEQEIALLDVVQAASSTGKVQFPYIIRFPEILKDRLDKLHDAFSDAISGTGYQNKYQGVFPIKVNQNSAVVEDLVNFGAQYNYGLEAGSKPELLIAMNCLTKCRDEQSRKETYVVCNGYKDQDYIDLTFIASEMKLNPIIVIEMANEVNLIKKAVGKYSSVPAIGIRAKLLTTIPGHFGSTSGKHGKFGLLENQIYEVAEELKSIGLLDNLKLLHFHIGSMIPTTSIVGSAVREATGIYCNLVNNIGAPMGTLDVGGGFGVDYDGTRSGDSDMSVAYGTQEYASTVVQAARLVCDMNGVAHPVLCSESGRAMVTHHSLIILETLSAVPEPSDAVSADELLAKIENLSTKPAAIHGWLKPAVRARSADWYSHATDLKKHGIEIFKLGRRLQKKVVADDDTIYHYHMNLSVFSMITDFWGIKQLFPMMPIHRLDERPTQKGTLIDITCDSDGKVEQFIGNIETLPLHQINDGDQYYVGVMLTGSYQEALATKHNLFGTSSLVRVMSTSTTGGPTFEIATTNLGPTSAQQLRSMYYEPDDMQIRIVNQAGPGSEELVKRVFGTMPYLIEHS